MEVCEVIVQPDFFLALWGLFGITIGEKLYAYIVKHGPKTFSYIFTVCVYFLYIQNTL